LLEICGIQLALVFRPSFYFETIANVIYMVTHRIMDAFGYVVRIVHRFSDTITELLAHFPFIRRWFDKFQIAGHYVLRSIFDACKAVFMAVKNSLRGLATRLGYDKDWRQAFLTTVKIAMVFAWAYLGYRYVYPLF
jgi:hypothetical protein